MNNLRGVQCQLCHFVKIIQKKNLQLTSLSEGETSNVCLKLLEAFLTFSSVDISSVPESTIERVLIQCLCSLFFCYTSTCNDRVNFSNYKWFSFIMIQAAKLRCDIDYRIYIIMLLSMIKK